MVRRPGGPPGRATSEAATLEPPLREILVRLRAEMIGALLYPHHGPTDHDGLAVMQHLGDASEADVARLWRRYLLERWLVTVVAPHERQPEVPAARQAPPRPRAATITAEGAEWVTHALVTEPITAGDRVAEKFAWYVAEFAHGADKAARQALRRPWHLLVAAKPVAVAQGLARAIWEIEPGSYARGLVRLAGPALGLADPWSMQVALDHTGPARLGLAALCARLGRVNWAERVAGPLARSVCPPREQACPPAHLAVVPPPRRADRVAEEIVAALRKTLPDDVYAMLEGCAVVGADETGLRLLGWSRPGEPPAALLARLCAHNPFGQGDERTPLVLALAAPRRVAQPTARKGAKASARRR